MEEVLIYVSLIIALASIITVLAKIIKQPPIIAYLISGVIVGPLLLNLIGLGPLGMVESFARIGVAFLLFIVGLSLDFRLLKEIGKVSSVVGIVEVVIVGFLGFLLSLFLGFNNISSIYLGIAIAFSSTVVVVKILADKKEINTLHGRIAIGILIVQDITASLALMIVPLLSNSGNMNAIVNQIGIALLIILAVFLIAKFAFQKFMNYLASNQETLFLFGIAWALALATIFSKLGFSMEIGALIAGMSLASSKYALDLEGKMKPLRDFFVILFFVFFGSQLTSINLVLIKQAIIFSLFVMLIKPLIVLISLKLFGYTKKTNFLTSISLAQVSEFSLILIMLGFSLGHLNQEIMNLSVLIALITIGLSTYLINHSNYLNNKLYNFLNIFENKKGYDKEYKTKSYDIVLFGYHRMGYKLLETIKKLGMSFLVVDYNPKVIMALNKQKTNCAFGDAGSKHFISELGLDKAKLIISTIPEEQSNRIIQEVLEETNSSGVFIATAEQPRIALNLYELGVDYVLIPHHLSGDYASFILNQFKDSKEKYRRMGKEHFRNLKSAKRNSNFD